jgi:hypothetical protein
MPDENDRMIQQLRVEGDAKHTVIIQQQNVNTIPNYLGKAGKKRRRVHIMEKMLWDLLAALPDPKLKSLDKLVVAMAVESFGNQKNAGGYLGISQVKVSNVIRDGADEIKPIVSKNLWDAGKHNMLAPGTVVPLSEKEMMELIDREPTTIKAIPEATVEMLDELLMKKLVAEGRILVSEINRNEL